MIRSIKIGFVTVIMASGMSVSEETLAMVNIGGQTCINNYSIYDYYTGPNGTGEIYYTALEPDGVTCFENAGIGIGIGGGGAGGGGVSQGVWLSVPQAGSTTEVNLAKKEVRTKETSCGDEVDLKARQVAAYGIKNPFVKRGTVVTLIMSDGKQKFTLLAPAIGATGWKPSGECS